MVLPVEPVMPTTRTANRLRHAGGELLERDQAVGHPDHGGIRAGREGDVALDQDGDRAGLHRLGDVAVPVVAFALEGHEQAAGGDPARVDGGEPEGADRCGGQQSAPGGGEEIGDPNRRWHAVSCGVRRRVYQPHGRATAGEVRSGGMPK